MREKYTNRFIIVAIIFIALCIISGLIFFFSDSVNTSNNSDTNSKENANLQPTILVTWNKIFKLEDNTKYEIYQVNQGEVIGHAEKRNDDIF